MSIAVPGLTLFLPHVQDPTLSTVEVHSMSLIRSQECPAPCKLERMRLDGMLLDLHVGTRKADSASDAAS